MDKHKIVKQLLDTLFEEKNVRLWTVHDNGYGTIFTLRFANMENSATINPPEKNTITYKPKSPYQVRRDRERLENHRQRVNTRSTRSRSGIETLW